LQQDVEALWRREGGVVLFVRAVGVLEATEHMNCFLHGFDSIAYVYLLSLATRISPSERIEFGWWDGNDVRRNYFIARDAVGAWL
jgi:hypothetical protein